MNIRRAISWTRLILALSLLCALFNFSLMAQDDSDEPLDEEAVAGLVEELLG
jgi:hypothetical protein